MQQKLTNEIEQEVTRNAHWPQVNNQISQYTLKQGHMPTQPQTEVEISGVIDNVSSHVCRGALSSEFFFGAVAEADDGSADAGGLRMEFYGIRSSLVDTYDGKQTTYDHKISLGLQHDLHQ